MHGAGNIIGLHSYSHPTVMTNKDYKEQWEEYYMNKIQLEKVIGERAVSVSYPCNEYNSDTIRIMREFDIEIGFRANIKDLQTICNNT